MTDHEPPTIDAEPIRPRRRRPWAALAALVVLVAVGLYVAWPAIEGGINRPDFGPEAERNAERAVAAIDAMETADTPAPAASPPTNDEVSSSPPVPMEDAADALSVASEPGGGDAPLLEEPAPTALEPAVLEDALAEMAARLEALEARPAPRAGAPVDLTRRLDALEAELAARGDAAELAGFQEAADAARADVGALAERVAGLEAALEAQSRATGELVVQAVSAGRLVVAASGGGPFAVELAALRETARGDAALLAILDSLQASARAQVPTVAALRGEFPAVARAVARAAGAGGEAGWVSETVAELKRIVTVRRIRGDLPPESVDARLLEAEQALAEDDLARAVTIVETYAAVGGAEVAAWVADARARLDVDGLLAELETLLVERVDGAAQREAGAG